MEAKQVEAVTEPALQRLARMLLLALLAGLVLCATNVWIILDPYPPKLVVAVLPKPILHPVIVKRPLPSQQQDVVLSAGFETNRITAFGLSDHLVGHPDAVIFRWFRVPEALGRLVYRDYWGRADRLRRQLIETGTTSEALSVDDLHAVAAAAVVLESSGAREKYTTVLKLGATVVSQHQNTSREFREYFCQAHSQ